MAMLAKQEVCNYRIERPLVRNLKDGTIMVPNGYGMYIGIYCITNRQYLRFVSETGHRMPDQADWGDPIWQHGKCPEDKLDHPVVCVSFLDALAYAAWAECDLPFHETLINMAAGFQKLKYPWGNEWNAARCRNLSNRGIGTTCLVYEYPEGVSGAGTYNQVGNVWEWCVDEYWTPGIRISGGGKIYKTAIGEEKPQPEYGIGNRYCGGSWSQKNEKCFSVGYVNGIDRKRRDADLGFRIGRYGGCHA